MNDAPDLANLVLDDHLSVFSETKQDYSIFSHFLFSHFLIFAVSEEDWHVSKAYAHMHACACT